MCHAEGTVNTFFWADSDQLKGLRGGQRKCANWDSFSSWAIDRSITYQDVQSLQKSLIQSHEPGSMGPG